LDKLKSQVEIISGAEDQSILDYSYSNKVLYKKVWLNSDERECFNQISKASIVICGDFHSSSSVKRFYTRFIKKTADKINKKTVVALECFDHDQQENLELWLKGRLSEEVLLEKTKWQENWGFSWGSYKNLIIDLHSLGVEFRCVNHQDRDFKKRDKKIAKTLVDVFEEFDEEALVFCIIGQHHLGPDNLIQDLKEQKKLEVLCLHLDPEELYFDIGHLTLLEETLFLKYQNHFAVFNSPPWVHWQNHLSFLEEYLDAHEEEYDFNFDSNAKTDYDLVVFDYIKLLCKDLDIDPKSLKRVEVSSIDEYQVQGEFDTEELFKNLSPFLDSETSFYWPEQKEGIAVVNSLNHAASVAGRSLHAQLMGLETLPWGDLDSFKVWSWLEAVGYFLSKFINPRRTPVATHNLGAFLKARLGEESSKKIMTFLVKSRVAEIKGASKTPKKEEMSWNELIYAARLKGSLVGECLFDLYLDGHFEVETIKTYMSLPVTDRKYFEPLYDFVVGRLNLTLNS